MQPHQLRTNCAPSSSPASLDTLEARLAQARAGELGHLEFLEVLLEDEIARREAKALSERIRRARFEEELTLEDFDFTYNPKLPVPLIRDLATLRFLGAGRVRASLRSGGSGQDPRGPGAWASRLPPGLLRALLKTSRVLAELAGGRADGSFGSSGCGVWPASRSPHPR